MGRPLVPVDPAELAPVVGAPAYKLCHVPEVGGAADELSMARGADVLADKLCQIPDVGESLARATAEREGQDRWGDGAAPQVVRERWGEGRMGEGRTVRLQKDSCNKERKLNNDPTPRERRC
eukprot:8001073-Pyramimonas_sp.AAC.1